MYHVSDPRKTAGKNPATNSTRILLQVQPQGVTFTLSPPGGQLAPGVTFIPGGSISPGGGLSQPLCQQALNLLGRRRGEKRSRVHRRAPLRVQQDLTVTGVHDLSGVTTVKAPKTAACARQGTSWIHLQVF